MGNPSMTKVTLGEGTTLLLMGIPLTKVTLEDEGGFLLHPPRLLQPMVVTDLPKWKQGTPAKKQGPPCIEMGSLEDNEAGSAILRCVQQRRH
jgi:hypothetical protein